MKVGFIGLGAMGAPMAGHIVDAGHETTVWSRRREPVEALVSRGAKPAADAADVARASDVTIMCVSDDAAVLEVVGALEASLGEGKILVDCSTIGVETEQALHERIAATGAAYLEAPVSGGTIGAEAGTLAVMVGGDAAVLERARPALEPFAGRVFHVGGPGAGAVVKLANNLVHATQLLAVAEATVMGAKAGLDLELMREVLLASTADCTALRQRVPFEGVDPASPASNDWKPGFATELMAKDLDLALAHAARAKTPLFTTPLVRQLLTAAIEQGWGRDDFSSLGRIVRRLGGV
jgi:3-hydroxyisobutyrate dehydrogenase